MFKVQSSRIVPAAPTEFTGTLNELFERHAKHVLADPCEVEYQHSKLLQWCGCTDPVFYVRRVKNLERGTIYTTRSGVRFRPSDNAPAWWMHSLMFNGIRDVSFDSAPTRMFGIRRAITGQTINSAGWHVAHIFNVNDRNTTWEHWDRAEVLRRFIPNIHPCNYFYIPKTDWRAYGCDSRVIGFFAAQYRRRYLSIWEAFSVWLAGPPSRMVQATCATQSLEQRCGIRAPLTARR